MRYAIIAAGEGSRLASEGICLPKPLVQVGGETLVDRLIRIFLDNGADEIVVICNDRTAQVSRHLTDLQRDGLNGRPVPLRFIVKSTPSSMHSLFEISPYLQDGPFILTTVDTVFRESEFSAYVEAFRQCKDCGLMGVTSYVDDEKPLWVETSPDPSQGGAGLHGLPYPIITGFHDTKSPSLGEAGGGFVSAGIYGLDADALFTLYNCIARGEQRLRNFQRALLSDGHRLRAYPFRRVFDVDHASDIVKAEKFLQDES